MIRNRKTGAPFLASFARSGDRDLVVCRQKRLRSRFLASVVFIELSSILSRVEHMTTGKRTFLAGLAAFFIAAVFWLGIFPPDTPRIFLNQRRAVESIRELNLAEYDFVAQHSDAGFACDLGDLFEHGSQALSRFSHLDRVLASDTNPYYFEIRCSPSVGRATAYTITAIPKEPGKTADYALCTDQRGEIWYGEDGSLSDCFATHKPVERKYK
jgi:hypothetical protein